MKDVKRVDDLQAIFDVVPSPVFVKDRNHQIVLLNSAACGIFGHSREALLTARDSDLFPPAQVSAFRGSDNRVFEGGGEEEGEVEVTDALGAVRTVIIRKRSILLGGEQFLVGVVTDVTARREAEARDRYLALHDVLTGLPNRALLDQRIDQASRSGGREPGRPALMYIDLDRFKDVNQDHGHQAGDALIRAFAARLKDMVRSCDTVARMRGDGFAILLPAIDGDLDPGDFCERVIKAASEAFVIEGKQLFVGASIGIAFSPSADGGQVDLHRRADIALYQAKREGRGCWRAFSEQLDQRAGGAAQAGNRYAPGARYGKGLRSLLSARGRHTR